MKNNILALIALLAITACGSDKPQPNGIDINSQPPKPKVDAPSFNADNAYNNVKRQVDFGARTPGSAAHDSCAAWLQQQFEERGAKVFVQTGQVERHDGLRLPLRNIIASFNEGKPRRILLCAHWDSRYIADQDAKEPTLPTPGADDGGSGVGVLLEIGRLIKEKALQNIGVDIVLFDVEDQGNNDAVPSMRAGSTWCLGSQFWSRTPHVPGYKAEYGILLDMVGSTGAKFPQEAFSRAHANSFVQRVWNEAHDLGYHDYFIGPIDREIIDDHVFVTELAKIPTLDIINLPPANGNRTFGHYWHTRQDNMDIINKNTLKAVGQTLTQLLYKEDLGAI